MMNRDNDKALDSRLGIQGFLLLDSIVRLSTWSGALFLSLSVITALKAWPTSPFMGANLQSTWQWCRSISLMILLFNLFYVLILVMFRLLIPQPREGRYRMIPGKPLDRALIWSCLIATLTKARYEPPFPAFLVYQMSNLPPLCWIVSATLGPKNRSCNVTEPALMDPHLIEIGRNVVIGFRAIIAAHVQDRDEIIIKKTMIEDDVIIGGHVIIHCGCRIGRGAVILGGAIVSRDTVVGENEIWGGVPAKKIKDLPPVNSKNQESRSPAD